MFSNLENHNLYSILCRFGNFYGLKFKLDHALFEKNLKNFENDWKPYNPRKSNNRLGLSLTSLDGTLSGVPDLDSLTEYNKLNNTNYKESNFNKITPIYEYSKDILDPFETQLGRTHVIKLNVGGYFPMHRDNHSPNIEYFRVITPISHCNPPTMHFLLEGKILNFELGRSYFLNTSLEHTLFNTGPWPSVFVVANVKLNEQTVTTVLKNLITF